MTVPTEMPKEKCKHGVWHADESGYSPICTVCRTNRDWQAAHFEIDCETQTETEMRQ